MKVKEETDQAVFNRNCRKALKIINSCQTQAQAMELLKSELGANAKLNMKCWFAYNNLPAK